MGRELAIFLALAIALAGCHSEDDLCLTAQDSYLTAYRLVKNLDSNYGSSGIAFANTGPQTVVDGMAIDEASALLAAHKDRTLFFVKLNASGKALENKTSSAVFKIDKVLVQKDARVLAAGVVLSTGSTTPYSLTLSRYTSTGETDLTFANQGTLSAPLSKEPTLAVSAMALASDGSLLIAATSFRSVQVYYPPFQSTISVRYIQELFVAKVTPQGALDTSFANQGVLTLVSPASALTFSSVTSLVVSPMDSGFYLAGDGYDPTNLGQHLMVMHFSSSGAPDLNYGSDGHAIAAFGDAHSIAQEIAFSGDGSLLAVGTVSTLDSSHLIAVKFLSNGSLDAAFGAGGRIEESAEKNNSAGQTLSIFSDGSFLLGGYREREVRVPTLAGGSCTWLTHLETRTDFITYRYDASGQPVTDYGDNGIVQATMAPQSGRLSELFLQNDGSLLGAGITDSGLAVIRLIP